MPVATWPLPPLILPALEAIRWTSRRAATAVVALAPPPPPHSASARGGGRTTVLPAADAHNTRSRTQVGGQRGQSEIQRDVGDLRRRDQRDTDRLWVDAPGGPSGHRRVHAPRADPVDGDTRWQCRRDRLQKAGDACLLIEYMALPLNGTMSAIYAVATIAGVSRTEGGYDGTRSQHTTPVDWVSRRRPIACTG